MNLLLGIANIYIPDFIKKKKLLELFTLTADAFQSDMPNMRGVSYCDCLNAYAEFSKTNAERTLENQNKIKTVKNRLYQNARKMGKKLRKEFHVKTNSEVIQLSTILYKVIDIEYSGSVSGKVMIKRCFFSQFYTPAICDIISALDAGVADGLSNGGNFTFSERITEGKTCCLATFEIQDQIY